MTVPITGMPTFVTSTFVHQAQLNLLSTGINNLSYLLTGVAATRNYIPAGSASINTSQTISNNQDQTVSWNVAGLNNDVTWSAGAPDHLTIVTPGVYIAWAQAHFAVNATGHRALHVMTNGTSIIANSVAVGAVTAVGVSADTILTALSPPMRLSAGATIYLSVYQNSGGNLNLLNTLSGSFLALARWGQ